MLDRTGRDMLADADRREARGYIVALAFFGAVGAAMIAWISAIAWGSWQLITWLLF